MRVEPSLTTGLALAVVVLLLTAPPSAAQEEEARIPGVRLGLLYETASKPALTIRPFEDSGVPERVAGRVEAVMARDLDYSDRFNLIPAPSRLLGERQVDYQIWDGLGVVWLLAGTVEPAEPAEEGRDSTRFVLRLQLHDVVYEELSEVKAFPVPHPDSTGFRMAVHRAADEVVEWIFGEPGMAASRIAFARKGSDGDKEIWLVDSDGENLRRVTSHRSITLSPAWSPDGSRLAYTSFKDGPARLYERELASGEVRPVETPEGQVYTPAYHPDGREIAFAVSRGAGTDIFKYDLSEGCCLRQLTAGRAIDMSPTYSPDGSRIAYMSDRLTQPHIYVTRVDDPESRELVSPYLYGEPGYYTSPDWSPRNDRVAFHGRAEGQFQILVGEVADRGMRVTQLTAEGRNEDPSWAPDGRHIVFRGTGRSGGSGLFVVDAVTGRVRPLVTRMVATVPDWSPTLRTPSRVARR